MGIHTIHPRSSAETIFPADLADIRGLKRSHDEASSLLGFGAFDLNA
jgi:hypothetical protein